MKTKKDCLIKSLIDGNNSFDIEKDSKITEDVMKAMQLYSDIKVKKQKTKTVNENKSSSRPKEFWEGFDFACQLLEDMGYCKSSSHPYNIADCLKGKMNRLPKNKIRKNKK